MNATEILQPYIIAAGKISKPEPGDYMQDGYLFCGNCHTAKQIPVNLNGTEIVVPCLCECRTAERDMEEAEEKERKRRAEITALRISGLQDPTTRICTFDLDDGQNPATAKCKRYAAKWTEMYPQNIGLMLWGNTGNGKTFAAAAIANALIEAGTPVLMVSFVRLLIELQGMYAEDKLMYLDSLNAFPLLILDDFGSERDTPYGLEQAYSVIDTRYKQRKPLIVTTNIPLKEMQNPKDMRYQRTYDRVLEMCAPIHFSGGSRREGAAREKRRIVEDLFK